MNNIRLSFNDGLFKGMLFIMQRVKIFPFICNNQSGLDLNSDFLSISISRFGLPMQNEAWDNKEFLELFQKNPRIS